MGNYVAMKILHSLEDVAQCFAVLFFRETLVLGNKVEQIVTGHILRHWTHTL